MKLIRHIFIVLIVFTNSVILTFAQKTTVNLLQNDSTSISNDSLSVGFASDTVQNKKRAKNDDIKAAISYSGDDSIRVDVKNQKVHIYGNAKVVYEEMNLEAEYIEIDWGKNLLHAKYGYDSVGKEIGTPKFIQGEDEYLAKEIKYNFKTEKGLINGIITQQEDSYIHGDTVKKISADELYLKNAKYTTCNRPEPHFFIKSKKMKLVKDKLAVTGPCHIVVEGIPTPIGLPFGIFPMPEQRVNGLIMPSPMLQSNKGIGLQGGGYYWAIDDYVRVTLLGDVFTNGSWRGELSNDYIYRYHYSGNLTLGLSDVYAGYRDEKPVRDNFLSGRDFKIVWKHRQLAKRKGTFSSDVNMISANYNKLTQIDLVKQIQTQFNSSISYTLAGKSPFSLTAKVRQTQQVSKMTFNAPDITLMMQRQTPFKSYTGFGKNSLKSLSFNYTADFRNEFSNITTPSFGTNLLNRLNFLNENKYGDTIPIFSDFTTSLANGNYGFKHSTYLQDNLKVGYITVNPYLEMNQIAYDKRVEFTWNEDSLKNNSDVINGINFINQYKTGVNFTTSLYGMMRLNIGKLKNFKTLMTPSVSYRFTPDLSQKYYREVQTDTLGKIENLSYHEGFIFGSASSAKENAYAFTMSGNIKMEIEQKTDTSTEIKKIELLKSYTISTSYNASADSLRWKEIGIAANTTIFNKKLEIQYRSSHSLYDIAHISPDRNVVVDKYYYKGFFNPLRTTALSLTGRTSLNPEARKKETEQTPILSQSQLSYMNSFPSDFVDFSIPWNATIDYTLMWNYALVGENKLTQTVGLAGNFSLSPKWKAQFRNSYDIINKGFAYSELGIVRDLHCWEMSLKWNVRNNIHGVYFTINAKASMLKDALKGEIKRDKILY